MTDDSVFCILYSANERQVSSCYEELHFQENGKDGCLPHAYMMDLPPDGACVCSEFFALPFSLGECFSIVKEILNEYCGF